MGMGLFAPVFLSQPPFQNEVLSFAYERKEIEELRSLLEGAGFSDLDFSNLALCARLESESSMKPFTDCLREIVTEYIERRSKNAV